MFKFFDPNSACFPKYDAFCLHIFDYACLRRKAYRYRKDSKLRINYIGLGYIKSIFENGWCEDAYLSFYPLDPSLAISYRNHQKILAYFSHLALLILFFFTKSQSQKGAMASPAAWPIGSERRFYDSCDRKVDGSTLIQVSLLRPWIRCFTILISTRWNLSSSKSKKSEAKFKRKLGNKMELLSESGFVVRVAPPSLSRDRRIKMKKSINQSKSKRRNRRS